jgi:hypothetical protein
MHVLLAIREFVWSPEAFLDGYRRYERVCAMFRRVILGRNVEIVSSPLLKGIKGLRRLDRETGYSHPCSSKGCNV